jgi:alcohol dehydrogenase (cytochrome c)
MRVAFSTALSVFVGALVVASIHQADLKVRLYAQSNKDTQSNNAPDLSSSKLTAHPTTSWPTNGGNLFNQRYSPLKAIDRTNVAQLKGVWRARLGGSGTAPQYSGFAQPLVRGRHYVSTGANDVFCCRSMAASPLAIQGDLDPNIIGVLRLEQQGCMISDDKVFIGRPADGQLVAIVRRHSRVVGFRPSAGRTSRTAAALCQQHGDHRFCRRRSRHAQPLKATMRKTARSGPSTIPGPASLARPGRRITTRELRRRRDLGRRGRRSIRPSLFSTGNAAPDYNGAFRAGDNPYAASMLRSSSRRESILALPAGASHLGL